MSASFSLIRIFQKILRVVSFSVDHERYETSGRSLTKNFIREYGAFEVAHLGLFCIDQMLTPGIRIGGWERGEKQSVSDFVSLVLAYPIFPKDSASCFV